MDSDFTSPDVANLFQAVLDSDRLSLIAHLSQQELTLSELVEQSNIAPKDIQRHLSILEDANLITRRERIGRNVYQFNPQHIEQIKRLQFSRQKIYPHLDSMNLGDEAKKVLADYTKPDGSLKMIPSKFKKIIAVLDYLILAFEIEVYYSEREVNHILEKYFADTTTLRRYLIDFQYLGRSRNGERYWRIISQVSDERMP
jgi:predicted transcriptional regulator